MSTETEKMVKAGKGGITFARDWDSTVEYDRLTGVRYDNKLFFSKKPVPIGLIPEDGEYWFLAYEGLTDEQWEALLNGTQQVGDSAKLGGKEASEYALGKDYLPLNGGAKFVNPVSDLNDFFTGVGLFHVAVNAPSEDWWFIISAGEYGTTTQIAFDLFGDAPIKTRCCAGGDWFEWKSYQGGCLPLSGGTVGNGTSDSPFGIKGKDHAFMEFSNKDSYIFGRIGFNAGKELTMYDTDWVGHKILHEGNKPSGTYAGNGSADLRTINTGGIGQFLLLFNTSIGHAIVSVIGASVFLPDGTVRYIPSNEAKYDNGILTLATAGLLNLSSTAYYYNVP